MKKLVVFFTLVSWAALMSPLPANAQWTAAGCGASWTICRARAVNRAYLRAHPEKVRHSVGCDALCRAKCDATAINPAACYVKWNRINLAGKGRECEKTLGRGPTCR